MPRPPLSPQSLHGTTSVALSRAWAPLAWMLVLSCGVWFFHEPPRPAAPVDEAASAGWIRPGVGTEVATSEAAPAPGGTPSPMVAPTAEQVLAEVSRRGRVADGRQALASVAPSSPESLRARLKQDPAAVHRETAGRRLRLQGVLAAVEAGEPGVLVLHLALPDEVDTVRVVASPGLASVASTWLPPRSVSLDCLSQGVVMGEWLLADCRE